MEDIHLKSYASENKELESFLTNSINSYGLEQLQGNIPFKLYCSCSNNSGIIIGAVMGTVTLNVFFISHLFVEEAYRNKNIGTRLLSAIEALALNHGCNILRLNTFNKNTRDLYIKSGFKETITISNYMDGFDLTYYEKKIRK